MTVYTVDLTGIQDGDTLVWDSTQSKFVVGPPTVQSLVLDLNAGDTAADLPSSPADSTRAVVKIGSGANVHQMVMRYSEAADRWEQPQTVVTATQADSWACDMGGYSKGQRTNWNRINDPVPFGVPFALLNGAHDLSASNFDPGTHTGVVTVDDTTSPHSFAFAATSAGNYLRIRDNLLSYTAKTSTTFTGCAVVQGTRGTIEDTEYVSQGRDGGWGFNVIWIPFAATLAAAEFVPQESLSCLMNSAPDGAPFEVGMYWLQYDDGDGSIPNAVPLSGGMGVGNTLVSNESSIPAEVNGERPFFKRGTIDGDGNPIFVDLPLAAPTKDWMVGHVACRHASPTSLSGSVLDFRHEWRWTAPGT